MINNKQPKPTINNHPAVWDLVLSDMADRDKMGTAKHGTRLQPHNGRDALVDAYQEALDLVAYLRQAIYEKTWKSVERGELPESSGYVLAVVAGHIPFIAMYNLGKFYPDCHEGEAGPTHWMPLPDGPKDGTVSDSL